jgi:hypothetical protein
VVLKGLFSRVHLLKFSCCLIVCMLVVEMFIYTASMNIYYPSLLLFLETFLAREQCEGTLWRQTDLPTLGYSE